MPALCTFVVHPEVELDIALMARGTTRQRGSRDIRWLCLMRLVKVYLQKNDV
jgi:hypothetical protein